MRNWHHFDWLAWRCCHLDYYQFFLLLCNNCFSSSDAQLVSIYACQPQLSLSYFSVWIQGFYCVFLLHSWVGTILCRETSLIFWFLFDDIYFDLNFMKKIFTDMSDVGLESTSSKGADAVVVWMELYAHVTITCKGRSWWDGCRGSRGSPP